MKYIVSALLYLILITACLSCKKQVVPVQTVEPEPKKEPHVYLAGTVWNEVEKKYNAFLVKDDELSFLNRNDEAAAILSMFVRDNDIYVGGYLRKLSDKSHTACYWKNGTPTFIDTYNESGSSAVSISVSGNNIYTCGWQNNSSVYRKNEISGTTSSQSSSRRDIYNSITVNSDDVYIGGVYIHPVNLKSVPAYWKNNTLVELPVPTGHNGVVKDIAIRGTDVYAVGHTLETDGKNEVATYWKNGTAVKVGDGSVTSEIYCISVSGNDVYMAGSIDRKTMVCWKNDEVIFSDLTTAQESTYPRDIYIFENDVYVAGVIYIDNNKYNPIYWKNGERHIFNNVALNKATAYGIAVLP